VIGAEPIAAAGLRASLALRGGPALARLRRIVLDPAAAQRRALADVLRRCGDTDYGRALGYARLTSLDDFRAAVPIVDYEAIRPWIDRQIETGRCAIAPERPLMYALSSGTTGQPKRIPVTREVVRRMRRAQAAMALAQQRSSGMFAGRLMVMAGSMREETLSDGSPAGAVTGLIYATMPMWVRGRYIIPPEVFEVTDHERRYALIARMALQHADLSAWSTANPSSFLRLLEHIRTHAETLTRELASGGCAALDGLPARLDGPIRRVLFAEPARAAALATAAAADEITPARLWPALRGVMTWTGGGCAPAATALQRLLPAGARLLEAGYVASEGRVTAAVDPESRLGLPLADDVFMEFVPVAAWDRGERETLLLHELQPDSEYQILLTTPAGLARYAINDVVRTARTFDGGVGFAFARKGRGVTSLTGEKLTEEQVNLAVEAVTRERELTAPFHLVLADPQANGYRALLTCAAPADPADLARGLDAAWRRLNLEYESKRSSGRLNPPRVELLRREAAADYRAACVAKGQREAQFKVLTLHHAYDCDFDFARYAL
jgi:hypothetical protein